MHAPLVGTSANCRYVADRLAEGIAPATAKLQMTHLHKMFRLAERAGKAILPLYPHDFRSECPEGIFRADRF